MVLKSKKKTVQDEINRLFKNSMLTGIPQIAAAGNWKKKITRTLVFIFCVAGFIYQTLSFMNVYWKYQTVVDVQVTSPIVIDKPAFTICSEIGFMSSRFCPLVDEEFTKKTGVYCQTPTNNKWYDYCLCHPRMCRPDGNGIKNVTLISLDSIYWIHEQPWDYVKQFVGRDEDYMMNCTELNLHLNNLTLDCKPPLNSVQVPCVMNGYYPEACFTRDSLYRKPDGKPKKVYSFGETRMKLKMFEMELPDHWRDPRFFISFHSPYTIQNPMFYGYMLEREHTHQFRLSKVIKKLLPYPYETDCIDYLEMWKARGGLGPTNVNECIQECLRNMSLAKHGCLVVGVDYPGYDPYCEAGEYDTDLIPNSTECMETRCKPACYEEYYVAENEKSVDPLVETCYKPDLLEKRIDHTTVTVLYSGMETTVYSYSPKYQDIEKLSYVGGYVAFPTRTCLRVDIETFSYVGGYVGIWLGISLIAVFDFLETVVTLMQYPFKRMRRMKQKNKVNPFYPEIARIY